MFPVFVTFLLSCYYIGCCCHMLILFSVYLWPAQGEHELTGNEDPSLLNAYIAYLPSRIAFKEGNDAVLLY